ncbi:hypothetical protein GCM10010961_43920 [Pseudodonghicola xiamenensis]|uniref:Uncharacterized protein n=1 Tax=Pseudodonghicola xiamenensis TaxID=337702 RepID=A0A8J3HBN6_9RHOB|nr:hypothetical protein GCM10010961_43920 [Pseudodonghicola xiamenensis]
MIDTCAAGGVLGFGSNSPIGKGSWSGMGSPYETVPNFVPDAFFYAIGKRSSNMMAS